MIHRDVIEVTLYSDIVPSASTKDKLYYVLENGKYYTVIESNLTETPQYYVYEAPLEILMSDPAAITKVSGNFTTLEDIVNSKRSIKHIDTKSNNYLKKHFVGQIFFVKNEDEYYEVIIEDDTVNPIIYGWKKIETGGEGVILIPTITGVIPTGDSLGKIFYTEDTHKYYIAILDTTYKWVEVFVDIIDDTMGASDPNASKRTYSIAKLGNIISSAYQYQGQVAAYANLPNNYTAAQKGYVWDVIETNKNYAWAWDDTTSTGHWDDLGGTYIAGTGILIEIGPNGTTISANLANIKIDGTALDIVDHAVNLTSKILTIYKANGSTEDIQIVTVPQPWRGVKLIADDPNIEQTIGYTWKSDAANIDLYYSLNNGLTWTQWPANTDITVMMPNGLCVWNKMNFMQGRTMFYFNLYGSFQFIGELTSLSNFDTSNTLTYYNRMIDFFRKRISIINISVQGGLGVYNRSEFPILCYIYGEDIPTTIKVFNNDPINDWSSIVDGNVGTPWTQPHIILFNGEYSNIPNGWTVQTY